AGPAAEYLDVRPTAGPRANDDVVVEVVVDVRRGHADAQGHARVVGEEAADQLAGGAVENLDVRAATGAGRGDDVLDAVAVHVAGGHAHAAGEAVVVGQEGVAQAAVVVVDVHFRQIAGVGPG